MRGGLIAAGLLLAVLAFALAFVPRKVALGSGFICAAMALVGARVNGINADTAFIGCWLSLGVAALSVYWPRLATHNAWLCMVFAANAGAWVGLVIASEAPLLAVLQVLPVLLLCIPATWCVDRGWAIVPRIVTSWLLAVAILVGAIPHLVTHPGYEPDHQI